MCPLPSHLVGLSTTLYVVYVSVAARVQPLYTGWKKTDKLIHDLAMERSAAYCRYYRAKSGGEIPVFRGGRQSGEGLGDILRSVLRVVFPIVLRGIGTFAGHTLDAHQKGATLKDAAKSAINPTLSSVTSGFTEQFRGNAQSGSGMRSIQHMNPEGGESGVKSRNVYKRPKIKRTSDGKFDPATDSNLHYNF